MNTNRNIKQKKCKYCETLFYPIKTTATVCTWECANLLAKEKSEKKKAKEWNVRKKELKEGLMTKSDWTKILQQLVNRYVRQRDGNFCISCNKEVQGKIDAGHMFSVGNYPSVRFDLRNINSQCIKCNQYNGGSLLEYRKYLIKKIGISDFEDLELKAHQNRQYSIPELKEMIEEYKILLKR
jgi:hypothetical protein